MIRLRSLVSRLFAAGTIIGLCGFTVAGCSGGQNDASSNLPVGARRIVGASQTVSGATVTSFAVVGRDNTVTEVGVNLPLAVLQNPPAQPGSGPGGAIAVLRFPAAAVQSTFFEHFELNWNPGGHPPERYTNIPHFDFHFYNVPESEVRAIGPGVDPAPPAANRVPEGYVYPGPEALVPEMGVHALSLAELQSGQPFTTSMVLGYYNGRMTFLEPMVTQQVLLQRQNFTLDVPRPAVLGRATRYPTRMVATYNATTDSYDLVFRDFVQMTQ